MNGLHLLEPHLPQGGIALAAKWFSTPNLTVKLVSGRKRRLGSYRRRPDGKDVILLSIDQDRYTLLVTMAHEVAHMQALQKWGQRIAPHGPEWQAICRELLTEAAALPSLPTDVKEAILHVARKPGGTHLNNNGAAQTFMKYNNRFKGMMLLSDLAQGTKFSLSDGRSFIKKEKKRTRYICTMENNGRNFLIGGATPVNVLE